MTLSDLYSLFLERGDSEYGGEAVTQLEHALQAADLAEKEGATCELIAAALLHDVGHLLHALPDDAPDQGVDDRHENRACQCLRVLLPPAVYEPIRMHVDAKRYLCAADPDYFGKLSEPSVTSLQLQGGPFSPAEVTQFEAQPFSADAIRLRRWDDQAKAVGLETPSLDHFWKFVKQARDVGTS